MALTPVDSSALADCDAMFVEVSPESFCWYETLMPTLAALMSFTAAATPAISGGPSTARVPVVGRIEPILSDRSLEPEDEDEEDDELEELPPLEQAARTTAAAAPIASALATRRVRRGKVMRILCWTDWVRAEAHQTRVRQPP